MDRSEIGTRGVTLVVAHPERKSSTYAMFLESVKLLMETKIPFFVSDLYDMNFNPIVSGNEFKERYNHEYFNVMDEQTHASHKGTLPGDVVYRFSTESRTKHDLLYSMETGILGYVGMEIIPAFIATDIYRISSDERETYKKEFRAYLSKILAERRLLNEI